jgi:peroxisomal coenzyme A diphosphatase NUDT7
MLFRLMNVYSSAHPRNKLGAVLMLLYERDGELRVLLTTRSKSLRSHPGQTALPGGKVDDTDIDFIHTAVCFQTLTIYLESIV